MTRSRSSRASARNVRSSSSRSSVGLSRPMSRGSFLRTAGMGAVGVAAAGMMASSVVKAATPPWTPSYKIGIQTSLTGWPEGGISARDILEFAINRQAKRLGVTFNATSQDCTCGGSTSIVADFIAMKSQGVNFFLSPSCSGSARRLTAPAIGSSWDPDVFYGGWTGFDQYFNVWRNTCVLSPGASADMNENWGQESLAYIKHFDSMTPQDAPLRYRTLTVTTSTETIPLGEHVCYYHPNAKVAVITENDSFAQGLAAGGIEGMKSCGIVPIMHLDSVQMRGDGAIAAIETAIYTAKTAGADLIVFNPFGGDGANNIRDALVNEPFDGVLYGSYGFVSGGWGPSTEGMWVVSSGLDTTLLSQSVGVTWEQYKKEMYLDPVLKKKTYYGGTDEYGNVIYTNAVDSFLSQWNELYLVEHIDATNILTQLIKDKMGNAEEVNKALRDYPQSGFFGTITWGDYVFPQLGDAFATYYYVIQNSQLVPQSPPPM